MLITLNCLLSISDFESLFNTGASVLCYTSGIEQSLTVVNNLSYKLSHF